MYVDVAYMREHGVTVEMASDERIEEVIEQAMEYIDIVTGMWFEPRDHTIKIDGSDHHIQYFGVPIITIGGIQIDGEVLDPSEYIVYNRFFPDDRPNPKMKRKRSTSAVSPIFIGNGSSAVKWPGGDQNIQIVGTWGYVDPNGNTPEQIRRVTALLAYRNLPNVADPDGNINTSVSNTAGKTIMEQTDGHMYSITDRATAGSTSSENAASDAALTGDPEIDRILLKFIGKKPRYMAVV